MEKINRLYDSICKERDHQYRQSDQKMREGDYLYSHIHKEIARAFERVTKRMEN